MLSQQHLGKGAVDCFSFDNMTFVLFDGLIGLRIESDALAMVDVDCLIVSSITVLKAIRGFE